MLKTITDNWWTFEIRGIAAVVLGLLALFAPGPTLAGLLIVFGVYAIVDGIFAIVAGLNMPGGTNWWLVVGGIAGIVVGVFTFASPDITALSLIVLIGAWSIATGVLQVIGAIQLRKVIDNEWLLAISGVLSVAFGVLVVAAPGDGALAILWLIGVYAIVFGVLLVALGFRVRAVGKDLNTYVSGGAQASS
jgi:uncharacterized membrane protein HdeD (DUF308 family)